MARPVAAQHTLALCAVLKRIDLSTQLHVGQWGQPPIHDGDFPMCQLPVCTSRDECRTIWREHHVPYVAHIERNAVANVACDCAGIKRIKGEPPIAHTRKYTLHGGRSRPKDKAPGVAAGGNELAIGRQAQAEERRGASLESHSRDFSTPLIDRQHRESFARVNSVGEPVLACKCEAVHSTPKQNRCDEPLASPASTCAPLGEYATDGAPPATRAPVSAIRDRPRREMDQPMTAPDA
eukprot:scaffold240530_cov30-Tisochrysis_lutea.AAC.2